MTVRRAGVALSHPQLPLAATLALAERADAAGLDLVGVGDMISENTALTGAVAARTRSVEVFSAVLGWTRTPVTVALAAATLQELSAGRYRLGLGPMPRAWSEGWHDVDYAKPVSRMRDYVAAIRAAMAASPGSPVDHDGPFYRIRGFAPVRASSAAPAPIYLAATRPRMTELAGEVADGVIYNTISSPAWLREIADPALRRGLDRAGRVRADADVGLLAWCCVDEDVERAIEAVRPGLAFYFSVSYFADVLAHHGFSSELERGRAATSRGDVCGAVAAVSDEMVTTFGLVGPATAVREQITRYDGLVDWVELAAPFGLSSVETREHAERVVEMLSTSFVRRPSPSDASG